MSMTIKKNDDDLNSKRKMIEIVIEVDFLLSQQLFLSLLPGKEKKQTFVCGE